MLLILAVVTLSQVDGAHAAAAQGAHQAVGTDAIGSDRVLIAVTVQGGGGVTILAQKPALGIAFSGFKLVVNIIFDELVDLGMELGLFLPISGERAGVGKLHESLEGDADALASVVAGNAGLMRDTRIDYIIHHDLGVARGLNGMNH